MNTIELIYNLSHDPEVEMYMTAPTRKIGKAVNVITQILGDATDRLLIADILEEEYGY